MLSKGRLVSRTSYQVPGDQPLPCGKGNVDSDRDANVIVRQGFHGQYLGYRFSVAGSISCVRNVLLL